MGLYVLMNVRVDPGSERITEFFFTFQAHWSLRETTFSLSHFRISVQTCTIYENV